MMTVAMMPPPPIASLVGAMSLALTTLAVAPGCEKSDGVKVVVVEEKAQDKTAERGKSESQLRAEFEARKKARENAPEPKLDPSEPREKLELIWTRGKKRLTTIYN